MKLKVSVQCGNPICSKKMQVQLPDGSTGRAKVRCKTCKHLTTIDIDALKAKHARPKTEMEKQAPAPKKAVNPNGPVLSLELDHESGAEQVIILPLGTVILGRGEEVDHQITLDDPYISRKHLALKIRQHPKSKDPQTKVPLMNCILKDYNSTNGTFLVDKNGNRTRLHKQDEVYLEHGSVFQIGATRVTVHFTR